MAKAERCKQHVPGVGGWYRQTCSRNAVEDGYCRQHHPDAVAARSAGRHAKHTAEFDRMQAKREWQRDVVVALQQIANGHNDPRGLANEIINKRPE